MYYYQPFYIVRTEDAVYPMWIVLKSGSLLSAGDMVNIIKEQNGGIDIELVEPATEISKASYDHLYLLLNGTPDQ